MKKTLTFLLAVLAFATAKANDGAFYAQGNHLIPITETTISVKKEILTITRVADTISGWGSMFKVNVYYEFFNPGPAKDLLVGFESPTPDGNGYSGTLDEVYAGQPYMYGFNVVMNGQHLPHQIAHVPYKYKGDYQFDYTKRSEDYYKNGRIVDMTKEQYRKAMEDLFKGEEAEEYLDWYGYLFFKSQYYGLYVDNDLPVDFSKFPAEQKRILKNIPFAYRGYVFKDKGLQRFFESTEWYIPNPDYQADMTKLNKNEKEWVQFWTK